tara:strand:+ start:1205 stop:4342 length:3138 start_codon:yes stop_codon:yes gene_type:complete
MIVKKIYHIADVHIRNYKRHKEYKAVFKKLLKYLKSNVDEHSLIYLAGDIVHSKNDMSPELIALVSDLFRGCADIAPTIVITGNHDANLNNDARLDALTPIVDAMNHPNLMYWKDTGIYTFGGIQFSVLGVYGSPEDWILADSMDGDYKIALHHGAVASAVTDLNWNIENEFVTPKIFKGFDLALLGDIHKKQYLDAEKTVAYAGSLIQQNHGEGIDHGLLVWDIETKESQYVRIENDIAYATIEVDGGKILTDKSYVDRLPRNLRLRIKYSNCTYADVQNVVQTLKSRHKLLETTVMKVNDYNYARNTNKTVLGDVRDVEYQNQLITNWIQDGDESDLVDIDGVRHINRVMNTRLKSEHVLVRNVVWKMGLFEFSNMFSYGTSNSVNFSNYGGIQGLFAPNASGKSTLLDAVTFCLFDKCSRTWKAKDILNNRKTKFKCKLQFELNHETYIIERIGTKHKKTGHVKVNVKFGKMTPDGYVSLNGHDRDGTNRIIRGYVGTYDDFLLTALSTQNDNKNFIFKSQRERKDLLNSFLDISIFEDLYVAAKNEVRDKAAMVKTLEYDINTEQYDGLENQIKLIQEQFHETSGSYESADRNAHIVNDEINQLIKQIQNVDETIDLESVLNKLQQVRITVDETKLKTESTEIRISEAESAMAEITSILSSIDIHELIRSESDVEALRTEVGDIKNNVKSLKLQLEQIDKQITHLNNHEYDPECDYCLKNPFVIEAKDALKLRPEVAEVYNTQTLTLQSATATYNELKETVQQKRVLYDTNSKLSQDTSHELDLLKSKLAAAQQMLSQLQETELTLNKQIAQYEKQEAVHKNNKQLNIAIGNLKSQYTESVATSKRLHNNLMDLNTRLISNKTTYDAFISKQQQLTDLYDEVAMYESYCKAISKYGVPYLLLKKVLPVIQDEVNQILNHIVDFYVTLEADDKNINCYIHYNEDVEWPVELASGMERFMISVAMRAALINVSNLPRPNFLAIDEGFGVADSEHMQKVGMLFEYLRSRFDFILCITHIDTLKDAVDSQITIERTGDGFSKITQ